MNTRTRVRAEDIPDWVVTVVERLSREWDISLDQASRLVMVQGALFFEQQFRKEDQQ